MEIIHWVIDLLLLALLIWFMIDGLTFLWVRRVYYIAYSLVIKTKPHCVIMVDVDNFKSINDLYTHKTGDRVLRKIGKILFKRSKGRAFRYGGEEFVILLPWVNELKAFALSETIRREVKAKVNVTVSIGIGRFEDEADKALYEAKKDGKNRTRIFKPG